MRNHLLINLIQRPCTWLADQPTATYGSGVGPTLYIIMESDLKTLSHRNLFCKYAEDTNLIVPGNSDIGLSEEFISIENWARANKLIINLSKIQRSFSGDPV